MNLARDWSFQQLKDAIVEACDRDDYPTVDRLVTQAWACAQASGAPAAIAEAHWCAGLAQLHRNTVVALRHFDAAYACYQAEPVLAARIQVNRGPLLGRLGKIAEGRAALIEAEATLRAHGLVKRLPPLLINLAELEWRNGDYAAMRRAAAEAEAIALQLGEPERAIHGAINLAFAAQAQLDLATAAAALERARAAAVAGDFRDLLARVAINQARLFALQDQLMHALRLLQETRTSFVFKLESGWATVVREEASLYERLGMFEEAYRATRAAAELFATHHFAEESVEAAVTALRLAILAETSLPPWVFQDLRWMLADRVSLCATARARAGQATAPTRVFFEAITAHPALHPPGANRAMLLAQADAAAAELDRLGVPALALQARLVAATLADDAAARYRVIAAAAADEHLPALEQQACEGLAEVVRGRAACEALERAAAIASGLRRQMPAEELKARALVSHSRLHARLVAAHRRVRNPRAALAALLRAKGELWAELAGPAASPDQDLLTARAALLAAEERLRSARDDQERQVCQRQVQDALATLRAARAERLPLPLPAPELLRAHIPPESAAIELLLGEDRVWACVCHGPDAPVWLPLGKTAMVLGALDRLALRQKSLQTQRPHERRARAQAQRASTEAIFAELHDLLIAPLCPYLVHTHLLIAPDGVLFDLPWAALYDRDNPAAPYLGQRHTIAILPSLALLTLNHEPVTVTRPVALGCADGQLAPHVEHELTTIARLFPTAHVLHDATVNDLATVASPVFLHLSAHGRLNPGQPLLSQLTLADGPFLLSDAFNLDLRSTALVLLSACETSASARHGGIALALAGSFLVAGAQAVLAGLWQIDAEATALLVEQLYRALATGADLATALRCAQQALRSAGYDHPYYWAGLQPLMRVPHARLPVAGSA